jgi:hypothetical protein
MGLVYPLLLFALAPNPAGPPPGLDGAALVWAKEGALTAQGSGVLVDRRERLLVTAWHVVGGHKDLYVLFPLYEGRRLLTAPLPYQERYKRGLTIRARVVAAEPARDLAVLQLDAAPEGVREVALAAEALGREEEVYFIGNPQVKNILWDRGAGRARGLEPKSWTFPTGQEVSLGVLEVETERALESGFSGGPAVNTEGELVGVTLAAREEKSPRVYCAPVGEVRRQLTRAYCTLAQSAILAGDDCHARGLVAAARRLAPDDQAAACLETVIAWLEDTRSPVGAALRYARWILRASTRGVQS